jgi:hypothetical protein
VNELLQDLRVALPGVQMLFGFLLTIPFDQRFEKLGAGQRTGYAIAVMATALASAFLIAPSVYQRIVERTKENEQSMIKLFSVLAIIGGVFLGTSLCTSLAVVASFLFGSVAAVVASATIGALVVGLWYVLPIARRLKGG